jgi:hypothetical protein
VWRRRGWRPLEREQHPLEVAREQLDDAVPLVTGDPMTTAKVLVERSAEREELESLPDGQLALIFSNFLAGRIVCAESLLIETVLQPMHAKRQRKWGV